MGFLLFLFLSLPASAAQSLASLRQSTAPIMIVLPHENDIFPFASHEFVLGSVSDPKGHFEINGSTVSVYKTGAFIAWLPVQTGTFTFHSTLSVGSVRYDYDRDIFVEPVPAPMPRRPIAIDPSSVSPSSNESLRPGDVLRVAFRGSPGGKAWFKIPHHSWVKMLEYNPSLGLYQGFYRVTGKDSLKASSIELYLSGRKLYTKAKVSMTDAFDRTATVQGRYPVMMKSLPEAGEMFSLLPGARVKLGESIGAWTYVPLSADQGGWISSHHLNLLPLQSALPDSETGSVIVKGSSDGAKVVLVMSEKVPFEMNESSDLTRLKVLVYYAHIHTNWIVYRDDSFVKEARIKQRAKDVVELTLYLRPGQRLWGYHASYEGNSLSIEMRRPPTIAQNALEGRTIFLDPGHMPSEPGAIGGLGTKEMDVNLAIAKRAEKILEKDGAKVLLSHQTDTEEVGLADRPKMAWDNRADVFISIHNNTLSLGENPFKSAHGFSIFYYLPQSLQLARSVEKEYKKTLPLPDEGTRYGNYLVLRMTEMPAILTESAYLSDPAQEADLLDPSFQNKIANAIVQGVKSFFNHLRETKAHAKSSPAMTSDLKPKQKTPIAFRHKWKKRKILRKRIKHHARKS